MPASTSSSDSRSRGVTPRVVVFSLLLAIVLGYLIPVIDYKLMNTFLGATHLPPGAVGVLLVLVLVVNPLLGLLSEKLRFSRNEALTVYICCLFSSLLPGHGAENIIVPLVLTPFYFANPTNKWLDMLTPHTKKWLVPALNADGTVNKAVVDGWFMGGPIPWHAWIVPMCFWGALVICVYLMLGCLAAMLRAQWGDREALVFPLLKLPLEMTEDLESPPGAPKFFKNPLMWTGFGVAVFIQAMRGLNLYFSDVPTVPLDLPLGAYMVGPPWNQIGWLPVYIFPVAVGIAFLLASEVSFSLWFFFFFLRIQWILLWQFGYPAGTIPNAAGAVPDRAISGFQMVGCATTLVALSAWTGREHFLHVARRAFGLEKARPAEKTEILSYPAAFWGFFVGLGGAIFLTCMAGTRLDLAVIIWFGYLVMALALTRLAVEAGMLSLVNDTVPLGIAGRLFFNAPKDWLNFDAGVMPASFVQGAFTNHMRGFAMPSFLHAFKLAHDRQIARRPLLFLLIAVVLVSASMGMATAIRLGYENGGLSFGNKYYTQSGSAWPTNFIGAMNGANDNAPFWNWMAVLFGALLTWGMMLARSRFAWFPFHPLGYLIAHSFSSKIFWFSIFVGWLAKVIISRFGGSQAYRQATFFFLGLAFGDVAMILVWLAVDGWQGRVGHQLLPG